MCMAKCSQGFEPAPSSPESGAQTTTLQCRCLGIGSLHSIRCVLAGRGLGRVLGRPLPTQCPPASTTPGSSCAWPRQPVACWGSLDAQLLPGPPVGVCRKPSSFLPVQPVGPEEVAAPARSARWLSGGGGSCPVSPLTPKRHRGSGWPAMTPERFLSQPPSRPPLDLFPAIPHRRLS